MSTWYPPAALQCSGMVFSPTPRDWERRRDQVATGPPGVTAPGGRVQAGPAGMLCLRISGVRQTWVVGEQSSECFHVAALTGIEEDCNVICLAALKGVRLLRGP
jgi:hypothetical protein